MGEVTQASTARDRKDSNRRSSTTTRNGSNGETTASSETQKVSPANKKAASAAQEDATKDSPKKRRKVNHACVYCRRSHMTCDLERPCTRCVKRSIGHLCHDEPRETTKKPKAEMNGDGSNKAVDALMSMMDPNRPGLALQMPQVGVTAGNLVQPSPVHAHPSVLTANNLSILNFQDWMYHPHTSLVQNMANVHPSYMFNAPEISDELGLMHEFVSSNLFDDTIFAEENTGVSTTLAPGLNLGGSSSLLSGPGSQANSTRIHRPVSDAAEFGKEIQRPASSMPVDKATRETLTLMAADQTGSDAPEARLKKLLQAKVDAGMLRPHDYVKGYSKLNDYMKSHMAGSARQTVLRQIAKFRPKFRERISHLKEIQLVYVEIEFEKKLMEYDRIFATFPIPACCWRRTGEICRGNKAMAKLIDIPVERLRDGKTAIHEIFTEKSLVNYWKSFADTAFNSSEKGIVTSVVLKNPDDDSSGAEGECCFSFIVKRDEHTIPLLIIGNFLPIK